MIAAITNHRADLSVFYMAAAGEPAYDRSVIRDTLGSPNRPNEQSQAFLERGGSLFLKVTLEDILSYCGCTFRVIFRFLGVAHGGTPALNVVEISQQRSPLTRGWLERYLAGD